LVALAAAFSSNPAFIFANVVTTTPTNMNAGQTYLVDTSTLAITLNLPQPALSVFVIVKDQSNSAGTNNITIHPFAGENIDGTPGDLVLDVDNSYTILFSDGTNWFSIGKVTTLFKGQFCDPLLVGNVLFVDQNNQLQGDSFFNYDEVTQRLTVQAINTNEIIIGPSAHQTAAPLSLDLEGLIYLAQYSGGQSLFLLPNAARNGFSVRVVGQQSGGWRIEQLAGQQIHIPGEGATTVGTGGYIESSNRYDQTELTCVDLSGAGLIWVASWPQSTIPVIV